MGKSKKIPSDPDMNPECYHWGTPFFWNANSLGFYNFFTDVFYGRRRSVITAPRREAERRQRGLAGGKPYGGRQGASAPRGGLRRRRAGVD